MKNSEAKLSRVSKKIGFSGLIDKINCEFPPEDLNNYRFFNWKKEEYELELVKKWI